MDFDFDSLYIQEKPLKVENKQNKTNLTLSEASTDEDIRQNSQKPTGH